MRFDSLFRKKNIQQILEEQGQLNSAGNGLTKTLGIKDLVAMGIAAIIGAGIFSTIGNASYNGGPAVILLFIFTAFACGFSALCYAEFASVIPISGSAYTYAYLAFGELIAWIIGWALIVEYAIGNIVVAISWSDYFTGLMSGLGWHIPEYFTMDYFSAKSGFEEVKLLLSGGTTNFNLLSPFQQQAYTAWNQAPTFAGIKLIADLPALAIVSAITGLIYRGVKETKIASNIMVLIKLSVIVLVIVVGAFYVNPENWSPFAPNGMKGVLMGVSSVFFAYIGFDALATTAEECKNPRKDLPISMIVSLLVCTVLYILIALVLTGLVSYKDLAVGDPLAFVFDKIGLKQISGIVAVSAVVAMASVLLVFQNGQPRIWMTMSRDGLLPQKFSEIHPKFKTPTFSTLVTGAFVSIPALFMNLKEVTDLSSIGTLFAFAAVCGGVIRMESHQNKEHTGFKVPYLNSATYLPILTLAGLAMDVFIGSDWGSLTQQLNDMDVPTLLTILLVLLFNILGIIYKLSLIPVLGLIANFYLMTQLGLSNWIGFGVWLVVGLVIYFFYGFKHSRNVVS
jgi:APA family basic amino acid/polyamine antiporter